LVFFIGGESVSVPDFDDQEELAEEMKKTAEEMKKKEAEKAKRQEEFDEMVKARVKEKGDELGKTLSREEFNEIYDEVRKKIYGEEKEEEVVDTRDFRKKIIDDEYGDDIKDLVKENQYAKAAYELFVDDILDIPEDQRDKYFYGLVRYMKESYKYYSEDDNFELGRKEYGWDKKWDIHNWAWNVYNRQFKSALNDSKRSVSSAEANRMLALQVMGGSFLAFLIAVLIVIFIQIEANTRPDNKDRT
jgi:hypothetical protein